MALSREHQQAMLEEFLESVRNDLVSHQDKWPDDWDGIEMRWLAEAAVSYNAPNRRQHRDASRAKRYKEFDNFVCVNHLF